MMFDLGNPHYQAQAVCSYNRIKRNQFLGLKSEQQAYLEYVSCIVTGSVTQSTANVSCITAKYIPSQHKKVIVLLCITRALGEK